MNELATPLIRQYNRIKAQYKNYLLLFRLGDFYELFNEDAKIASRVLNIALTRKSIGKNKKVPLAGIPYHSIDSYLAKLIKAGHKVAICEQVEDPKRARGIVKREVVRIVTPGTVLEDSLLEDKSNNYLVAFSRDKHSWGLAAVDLSTGEFSITELPAQKGNEEILSELSRLNPAEILVPGASLEKSPSQTHLNQSELRGDPDDLGPGDSQAWLNSISVSYALNYAITPLDKSYFDREPSRQKLLDHFQVQSLKGFGAEDFTAGIEAAGATIQYLEETQQGLLPHINTLKCYRTSDYMILDLATQQGLELVRNLATGGREATLISILDRTITSMGGRLLKKWLLQPLRKKASIQARLEGLRELYNHVELRQGVHRELKGIYDMERIMSRVGCRQANARDLVALRMSLDKVPLLIQLLQDSTSRFFNQLLLEINPMQEQREKLAQALVDSPPATLRDGGIIKDGYNKELDELRTITRDSKRWLNQLQEKEIKRTGLQNLKIGYNRVFGYYIEITKAALKHLNQLPEDYIRKQTLLNAERFVTPEIKEKEEIILNAQEKIKDLEYELFEELREYISGHTSQVQALARAIAEIDCLYSLAEAAIAGNYIEPEITDGKEIEILDGRHPVLEAVQQDLPFVPNDARLDNQENQILIITGPNMAGKSTYIRQVALMVLMAHIGSFVPAKTARICLVDRIFSRIIARDYLARGQSTFLVEMSETANILNNATDKSLVILDEIGRGTSTYDGLSIAWAVVEYLHNSKGCRPKTLFATHYHELTELESLLDRVRNYNVAVLEAKNKITFLYKIVPGSTDRSYGIYAAQLAGLPRQTLERARDILFKLECERPREIETKADSKPPPKTPDAMMQLSLFDGRTHPALVKLRQLDINQLTPLQALQLLAELIKDSQL